MRILKKYFTKPNIIFLGICGFILIIKFFFIYMADIPSGSMENTLPTSSKVIGNRLAYIKESPNRGDIIIFKCPLNNIAYVKRIIGLPGEKIEINNSQIYINDQLLEETYLKEIWTKDNSNFTFTVPTSCYFVLGDNRNNSFDSRYWSSAAKELNLKNPDIYSFVSKDKIKAKVVLIYYPKIKIL